MLSECADQLAVPLFKIFSKSLQDSTLPMDWKQSRITPIFKKGSKKEAGNYRPVMHLSIAITALGDPGTSRECNFEKCYVPGHSRLCGENY